MANTATAYRDVSLSDRTADASFAAILAYLQDSTPPQLPLPPLTPDRRAASQHLPPVKNLLTQPEGWTQSTQDVSGTETQNNVRGKVCALSGIVG